MRKLMWFAIGFAIAIAVGVYLVSPEYYLLASGIAAIMLAVSLVCMLRFRLARQAAMACLATCLGFVWLMGFDGLYLSVLDGYNDQTMTLTIVASDYSYATDYGAATEGRITLDGKQYRVQIYHDAQIQMCPGDTVTGPFLLRSTLPGGAQDSQHYRSNHIFLTARPRGELTVTPCEKTPLRYYPAVLRRQIQQKIDTAFPADTAGFAKALLLGDTDDMDYQTDTAFKVSGIRHVIAVSGLHVSVLFSLVYILTGRKKWLTALLGLPVLFIFAAVAGFTPSITRACIMHSLMVIGMLFDKEYDPPTSLAFAVVCMLAVDPWVVTNVGFQLSALCVVGILTVSGRLQGYLMDKKRFGKAKGILKKLAAGFSASASVSLGAVIFTTPLCACYFNMVSLAGPLTNFLALWVISFIFYGIVLVCGLSVFLPGVAAAVAWLVSWPIRYVLWIAKIISDLPLSAVYTESVYVVIWLIFAYMLLAAFCILRKKRPLLLGCCAAIGLCVALAASWTEPLLDDYRITVVDVGQGQCILLQSEGKTYMVDCGSYSDTYAADRAASVLLSQGISRLDGVILTHFDADHAGGVAYLLTRIRAEKLYLPNCLDEDNTAEVLMDYAGGEVITVQQDTTLTFGTTVITMYPSEKGISNNENGLCILFQKKNCDILITGDRSAAGERELLQHTALPDLEILIVGHHGSKYSTSRELLIKTTPDIAIISVGADNSYGHPTQEVLDRLTYYGCRIYRTDRDGTVTIRG